jgi:uncharacterized protein
LAAAIIMLYDILDTLRRGDKPITVDVDAPPPPGTGLKVLAPVTGTLTLTNTGTAITAQGTLAARIVLECARCLQPHEVALDIRVNEICSLSQVDEPVGEDAEDLDTPIPIQDEGAIDLSELVRQLLVLHAPPRSLCRPGCRGLCAVCGHDLNESPCGCEGHEVDPRLEGLRGLLP